MTIKQTTPASSPLDTLKALVLRVRSDLDYALDQLAGGEANVPEELLDFLSGTNDSLYDYLGEHVALEEIEPIPGVQWRKPGAAAYVYDDGTPVVEFIESEGMTSSFYPCLLYTSPPNHVARSLHKIDGLLHPRDTPDSIFPSASTLESLFDQRLRRRLAVRPAIE